MIMREKSISDGHDYHYCPWLLGSQPCEKAFRAARSMSSTFSTMANFNILGLLRRLYKLQIQIQMESQSNNTGIIYPQDNSKQEDTETEHSVKVISNADIEDAVKSALEKAKKIMEYLGMKDLLVATKNGDTVCFGDVDDVKENYGEDLEENDDCDMEDKDGNKENKMDVPFQSELSAQECNDMIDSLEIMDKYKMVDEKLKENISFVCRKKIDSTDESDIPVYNLEQKISSNEKPKRMKLDKRFLEVIHNGEPIYIRKSTVVWLLQEGERVSSDRLLRVRAKQPYNSSMKFLPSVNKSGLIPQVMDTIKLGDFCVFLDKSVSNYF